MDVIGLGRAMQIRWLGLARLGIWEGLCTNDWFSWKIVLNIVIKWPGCIVGASGLLGVFFLSLLWASCLSRVCQLGCTELSHTRRVAAESPVFLQVRGENTGLSTAILQVQLSSTPTDKRPNAFQESRSSPVTLKIQSGQ